MLLSSIASRARARVATGMVSARRSTDSWHGPPIAEALARDEPALLRARGQGARSKGMDCQHRSHCGDCLASHCCRNAISPSWAVMTSCASLRISGSVPKPRMTLAMSMAP